jgi:hypothetical protein
MAGSHEVRGSSPLGSTPRRTLREPRGDRDASASVELTDVGRGPEQPPLRPAWRNGPNNAQGAVTTVNAEGLVGNIAGLLVYTDPNIPTTLTAGVGS